MTKYVSKRASHEHSTTKEENKIRNTIEFYGNSALKEKVLPVSLVNQ